MCVDYRKPNADTVNDCFSPPFIDNQFNTLEKGRIFLFLDRFSGFYQISIYENLIERTPLSRQMYNINMFECD